MAITDLTEDYYELLGVPRNATPQQIKKAYRKKAPELHPDHGGSKEEFIALKEAYETLIDPEARKEYDRSAHKLGSDDHTTTPPPSADSGPPVRANPYVTPDAIVWKLDATYRPEPVKIRLSNRSGLAITKFGPESMSGACWTIDDWDIVMDGEDLADYVLVPASDMAMADGQKDKARFFVDDQIVTLAITLVVKASVGSTPPPTESTSPPRRPPPERTVPETGHAPIATPLPRRRILAVVLVVACVVVILALTHSSAPAPHSVSGTPTTVPSNQGQPLPSHSNHAAPRRAKAVATSRARHSLTRTAGQPASNSSRSVKTTRLANTVPRNQPVSPPAVEVKSGSPSRNTSSPGVVEAKSTEQEGSESGGGIEAASPGSGK